MLFQIPIVTIFNKLPTTKFECNIFFFLNLKPFVTSYCFYSIILTIIKAPACDTNLFS